MKRDDECKAVKSKDVKEEEVARVPIAFAMVKLMQTLPTTVMDVNLPGYVHPVNVNIVVRPVNVSLSVCVRFWECAQYIINSVCVDSILMKMCVLLRNRFQEIRDVARNTLIKIIETLGVKYLQYLLKEMKSILVKGYQVNTTAE